MVIGLQHSSSGTISFVDPVDRSQSRRFWKWRSFYRCASHWREQVSRMRGSSLQVPLCLCLAPCQSALHAHVLIFMHICSGVKLTLPMPMQPL